MTCAGPNFVDNLRCTVKIGARCGQLSSTTARGRQNDDRPRAAGRLLAHLRIVDAPPKAANDNELACPLSHFEGWYGAC
jgi:hypothetical protein